MRKEKVDKLVPGLYIIKWRKEASIKRYSLASVGVAMNGEKRWLSCCEWGEYGHLIDREENSDFVWEHIKKVTLLISDSEFQKRERSEDSSQPSLFDLRGEDVSDGWYK